MEETTFDPDRRLCPDGSCVGVLDAEGRCSVCGHGEAASALRADEAPAGGGEIGGSGGGDDAGDAGDGFDPGRHLCDDGSCVGIVGPDGACGVCGRKGGRG